MTSEDRSIASPRAPEHWERRIAALWERFPDLPTSAFLAELESLTRELPRDHPVGLFERACGHDSTGRSDLAVPLYEAALGSGLDGIRRRRASIQLASSLRNLGRAAESVALLESELTRRPDELEPAVRAFLALALFDTGQPDRALFHSLQALTAYLPRYNASLARYAAALLPK